MNNKIPLNYYGGKYRISKKLIELFPPHTTYCEPFCGGASVFWCKPRSEVEILNDHDERLIALYRCMQEKSEEFLRRIEYTPYSEAEHRKASQILKNYKQYSQVDIAWAVFINMNQGFSGVIGGGWSRSKGTTKPPVRYLNKKKALQQFFKRLEKVYISCCDAIKCLDYWDSEDTLFYLDPPYPGAEQGHYSGYTVEDFNRLCERLDTIEGSFLLSCYERSAFKIPDSWEKYQIKTIKSAGPDKCKSIETVYRKVSKKVKRQVFFM